MYLKWTLLLCKLAVSFYSSFLKIQEHSTPIKREWLQRRLAGAPDGSVNLVLTSPLPTVSTKLVEHIQIRWGLECAVHAQVINQRLIFLFAEFTVLFAYLDFHSSDKISRTVLSSLVWCCYPFQLQILFNGAVWTPGSQDRKCIFCISQWGESKLIWQFPLNHLPTAVTLIPFSGTPIP